MPAPPHWGGFRVVPDDGGVLAGPRDRLHDRLRYVRGGRRRLAGGAALPVQHRTDTTDRPGYVNRRTGY